MNRSEFATRPEPQAGRVPLPYPVEEVLAAFLDAAKSGTLQLDVKDGRIVEWRLMERGRVR